jgi:4-amino-4-deoxy-L-arabinose transferase-like glycosyltransferase
VALALAAALAMWRLGAAPLYGDEAIYANVARNAAVHGQWYPLRSRHGFFVSKQGVLVWPMALSFSLLGVNEIAARLPSACCAVATAGLLYAAGAWLFGRWTALLAAALLASSRTWLFEHGARAGVGDPLLALLLAAALLLYLHFRTTGRRRWLFAAAGLALASGLIKAMLAPAMLAVITLVWEGLRRVLPQAPAAAGEAGEARHGGARSGGREPGGSSWLARSALAPPLLLLAIGVSGYALWFLDMSRRRPGLAQFLYRDWVVRATEGLTPLHVHGQTFYPELLDAAFGHWWIGLVPAGFALARLWRGGGARARAALLLAVWPVVVVVGLSFSVSKLPWYLDPALPAVALLLAAGFGELGRWLARWPVLRAALVCGVLALLGLRVAYAWRTLTAPVAETDSQRLVALVHHLPGARVYSEDCHDSWFREWTYYYLNQLDDVSAPVPPVLPAGGCRVVITDRPRELLRRPGYAGGVAIPFEQLPQRDTPLTVLDYCGGRIVRQLVAGRS